MAAVWSKVLSFALQMVFARLRGKSTAIIDCCTPRPLLSFAAEPVINDNACRYGPLPRNFPAPHSARLIGMLSSEAWVGKRDSSLAIERIPENAKRMPEFKHERGTDRMSSLRHRRGGAGPREISSLIRFGMREPPAAVAPTRLGDADRGSAKRRADRHHCALVARGLRQFTL